MFRTHKDVVEYFKQRRVVLPDEYYGKQRGLARNQAFSVSGMSAIAQVQHVKDMLDAVIAQGESFGSFKKRVADGGLDVNLPAHRLENIYRTNVQAAFNTGRCLRQTKFADIKPYRMYDAVNDDRTRPHHAAMDGYVARIDDPIWQHWYAPNGYQCRCKVTTLTETKARRLMQKDEKRRSADPQFARDRETAKTSGPDDGWDYSVCVDPNSGIDRGLDQYRIDEKYRWFQGAIEENLPPTTMPWAGALHGKDWHDSSFTESPVPIQNIVGQYSDDLTAVTGDTRNGGAFYSPFRNTISMHKETLGELSSAGMWRHEFGHLVDFVAGQRAGSGVRTSSALTAGMRKDVRKINKGATAHKEDAYQNDRSSFKAKLLVKDGTVSADEFEKYTRKLLEPDLKALGIKYDDMVSALRRQTLHHTVKSHLDRSIIKGSLVRALKNRASQELLDVLEHGQRSWSYHNSSTLPMLSDAFGACSNNKVRGCSSHSNAYFKKPESREKEIFANLFSLYGDHNPFWRQVAEIMMPNVTAAFNRELGL